MKSKFDYVIAENTFAHIYHPNIRSFPLHLSILNILSHLSGTMENSNVEISRGARENVARQILQWRRNQITPARGL